MELGFCLCLLHRHHIVFRLNIFFVVCLNICVAASLFVAGKHHQAYVDNLNALVKDSDNPVHSTLESIIKNEQGKIYNQVCAAAVADVAACAAVAVAAACAAVAVVADYATVVASAAALVATSRMLRLEAVLLFDAAAYVGFAAAAAAAAAVYIILSCRLVSRLFV